MNTKKKSLRRTFLNRLLSLLIIISLLSGSVQLYLMNKQIKSEIESTSAMIAQSVEQGIKETDLASQMIEEQINLKMINSSKHIGDQLNKSRAEDITQEELERIKSNFGLAGITLLTRKADDIVAVKSTDEKDVGFSTKSFGPFFLAMDSLLKGETPDFEEVYFKDNIGVLPISQSLAHNEEPAFFKYAYYHPPGTDYIINPFMEAGEVYQFTKEAGPDQWIESLEKENSFVKEVNVLNPAVFKDPSLESNLFPPVKKVVYGDFQYKTKEDESILKVMADHPERKISIQETEGQKLYKMFLPTENNQIIFIALDYKEIVSPLYGHSVILLIAGLAGLIVLTILTIKFFDQIYENIQKIISQIKNIEKGDLTAKSNINDGSELGELSRTANRMVDKLNELLTATQVQAEKTQVLSNQLEMEASQSVDRMYSISTEATIKARDQLEDISEFLNQIMLSLEPYEQDERVRALKESIESMRSLSRERTASFTETTLTLSDLVQALHKQSSELSAISKSTIQQIDKFTI